MVKKGSLNLSIQAIVIVVIAFVVLGLGLSFVRSQFKSMEETSSSVQEQIKQQILDDLRTGNKKLSFPTSEVSIGKAESSVIAIGIKNVNEGELQYKVEIKPLGGDPIFGGTVGAISEADIKDSFLYSDQVESLGPTETRVIPIRITSGTIAGTGQFKISISDEVAGTPYDSKTFFITVTG